MSYSNTAESTRQMADVISQVGLMGPAFISMAPMQEGSPDLKPLIEVAQLLPSVAQIIKKFDFIESTLSVTQNGLTASPMCVTA